MKTIGAILIGLAIIAGVRYFGGLIYMDYQLRNPEKPTTQLTKEEYIAQVRANGSDESQVCAYNKLIDQYGVNETLKMDLRATADGKDIDPRIYTALQECL